jgi:phosphoribosylformimino-5-aminoimidazole carboxamide ribotide isomerase
MLIPSIDLLGGKIVKRTHGEQVAMEFTAFEEWMQKFQKYPLVHLVDIDAVYRQGNNAELVKKLASQLPCQIGGGVQDATSAKHLLDLGAKRVVVGSALIRDSKIDTDFASKLEKEIGKDKLVFSVDTKHELVAVDGWRKTVNITLEDAIKALEPYCKAFMHTHIDMEGSVGGFPMPVARRLIEVTKKQLMVGGGIHTMEEVAALDALGIDSVVGMAIYSGTLQI